MTQKKWRSLYQELDIDDGGYEILPKPSNDDFVESEKTLGIKFPRSYRSFVRVFGAGRLNGFPIFAPGYRPSKVHDNDLRDLMYSLQDFFDNFVNGRMRDEPFCPGSDVWQNRICYFTFNPMSRNLIGWDVSDIHDSKNWEYGIYEIDLDDELEYAPVLIATSFTEFIHAVCLSDEAQQSWRLPHFDRSLFEPAIQIL